MARVRRGTPMRGIGAAGTSVSDWCASDPLAQSFASELFHLPVTLLACPFVSSNAGSTAYAPMPNPPAPSISLVSGPAGAAAPGAVFAGTDASGNPIYGVPQTAQANMTAFKATIDQYMSQQGEATPPPPPPDCTTWYSFLNPDCGGGSFLPWALAGVVGVLLIGSMLGGRR